MSSATACMQASGSRSTPSASASQSAHLHRSSGGLARRLRGVFINDTLRGGYDIFGVSADGGVPGTAVLGTAVLRARGTAVLRARGTAVLRVRLSRLVPGTGDAEMPLDRAQPVIDHVQQALDHGGRLSAPRVRRGESALIFRVLLDLPDHLYPELPQVGAEPAEYLDGHAVIIADQPEQQVLGAHVVVVELPGLLLGEDDGSPRLVSEPLEHDATSVSGPPPPRGSL